MTFQEAIGIRTLFITSGPSYHDSERFRLFRCANVDLEADPFIFIEQVVYEQE